MFKIPSEIYDRVIQLHIHGYSMEQIARIIGGISKTTVHNIIHDWNQKISAGSIEDIRFFMRTLRESGITIEKCIEGFRIQQMLKEFGIPEEPYEWIEGDAHINIRREGSNDTSKYSYPKRDEAKSVPKEESLLDIITIGQREYSRTDEKKNNKPFNDSRLDINPVSFFVQILYKECKTHKLAPSTTVKWIRDMLDLFSVPSSTVHSTSDEQPFVDLPEYVYSDKGEGKGQGEDEGDNSHVNDMIQYAERITFTSVPKDPSVNLIDLPLISKVPFFIEQKKDEINRLVQKEKNLKDKIQEANEQKIKIKSEVDTLVKKHTEIFRYFRWYKNLGQELSVKYNVKLENEIEPFYRAINDFKRYDYDPWRIISEYKYIDSLNQVKESILEEINLRTPLKDQLLRQVTDLNNQLGWCSQTIGIYNELCGYGFGLKELKILRQTLVQVAVANNMTPEEIGKKFLKDIEDQYDDKVGFENKIRELKIEKTKLEEEVPIYKSTLTLQAWASVSLLNLHNDGVTDIDIICMSGLVSDFKHNDFLSGLLDDQNNYSNNILVKVANSKLKNRYSNNNNNNNQNNYHDNQNNTKQSKLEDWHLFVQKLKELKNVNYLIKDRKMHLENLIDQINELEKRKRNLEPL